MRWRYASETFPCGVLAASEIKRLNSVYALEQRSHPLISPLKGENLQAAGYDVRIARDGMRPPGGPKIKEGLDEEEKRNLPESLVLHPGDSASLSTLEEFCLPKYISGTVTLRARYAAKGLFLLSGTLINPGYGMTSNRRLHFFVANLGPEPIVLHLEQSAIAAVQFFTVAGSMPGGASSERPGRVPDATPALGFIESVRDLQKSHKRLDREMKRTRDLTRIIIVLGYFVLGAAVISASLGAILSVVADRSVVSKLHAALLELGSGTWLLGAIAVSVAWMLHSAAIVFGPARALETVDADAQGVRDEQNRVHDAAVASLRSKRKARVMAVLVGAIVPVVLLVAHIRDHDPQVSHWVRWTIVAVAIALAVVVLLQVARKPLEAPTIRREMDRLTYGRRTRYKTALALWGNRLRL